MLQQVIGIVVIIVLLGVPVFLGVAVIPALMVHRWLETDED